MNDVLDVLNRTKEPKTAEIAACGAGFPLAGSSGGSMPAGGLQEGKEPGLLPELRQSERISSDRRASKRA